MNDNSITILACVVEHVDTVDKLCVSPVGGMHVSIILISPISDQRTFKTGAAR